MTRPTLIHLPLLLMLIAMGLLIPHAPLLSQEARAQALRVILSEGSLKVWDRPQYFAHLSDASEKPKPGRQWIEDTRIMIDLIPDQNRQTWKKEGYLYLPGLPGQSHRYEILEQSHAGDQWTLKLKAKVDSRRTRPVFIGGSLEIDLSALRQRKSWKLTSSIKQVALLDRQHLAKLEKAWGMGHDNSQKAWSHPRLRNALRAALAQSQHPAKGQIQKLEWYWTQPNLTEIKKGDHPRLLFKKEDLPQIKARLQSPQGQRILKRLEAQLNQAQQHGFGYHAPAAAAYMEPIWAAGHAFMFQLTDDPQHAARAYHLVRGAMYAPLAYGGGWAFTYRLMGTALAYDMCYELWTPAQRQSVAAFLFRNAHDMTMRYGMEHQLPPFTRYRFADEQHEFRIGHTHDLQGYKFQASAALAILALLGDDSPIISPIDPNKAALIPPAKNFSPRLDVPVTRFTDNLMPKYWLLNGPFLPGVIEEQIKSQGGFKSFTAVPGQGMLSDGVEVDFRRFRPSGAQEDILGPRIYPRADGRYWASATGGGYHPGIGLIKKWKKATQRKRVPHHILLYTVIQIDEEMVLQGRPNWGWHAEGIRLWLNGAELKDGALARVTPGLYRLMVDVPVGSTYSNNAPRLKAYTSEDYQKDLKTYEAWKQYFTDLQGPGLAEDLRHLMLSLQHGLRDNLGSQGLGGEHMHNTLLPLAIAWRHMFNDNPLSFTSMNQMPQITAVKQSSHEARQAMTSLMMLSPMLSKEQLSLSRALLDQNHSYLGLPYHSVLAALIEPLEISPDQSLSSLPSFIHDPQQGLILTTGKPGDHMATGLSLRYGRRTLETEYQHGHFMIYAKGFTLFDHARRYFNWPDRGSAHRLVVEDRFADSEGSVEKLELDEKGRGIIQLELSEFMKGKITAVQGGKPFLKLDKAATQMKWHRWIAINPHEGKGLLSSALVVDELYGAGTQQQYWQLHLPKRKEAIQRLNQDRSVLIHYRSRDKNNKGIYVRLDLLSPTEMNLELRGYSKGSKTKLLWRTNLRQDDRANIVEQTKKNIHDEELDDEFLEIEKEFEAEERKLKNEKRLASGKADRLIVLIRIAEDKDSLMSNLELKDPSSFSLRVGDTRYQLDKNGLQLLLNDD